MATDNNIKNYTGADIEKYHKGLLSAKEMHGLEKAAMDDPFLAEALEGYAIEGVDHSADIDELKKRLDEKVEAGKVIIMKGGSKTSFPWLRVAALVVIIAGAGLMAREFIFTGKTKDKDIAQAKPKKTEETKLNDSANTVTITSGLESKKTNNGTVAVPLKQKDQTLTFINSDSTADGIVSRERAGETVAKNNEVTVNKADRDKPPATAPVKTAEDKKIQDNIASGAYKKDITPDEAKNKPGIINTQDASKEEAKFRKQQQADIQNKRAVTAGRQFNDQGYRNQATNTFRGRVTDANNVGLPFARVYNPTDNNAGTYTDVAGNFNLTYPDSVISVQVRSVGFENVNVQLRNNVANNQVILQDDRSLAAQTLPAPRKINAEERSKAEERNKFAKVKLEEPEPADGWDNYDTYLTNNLNVPEEIKTKQNDVGQVQVSFEVDKNGNPVNIKVEKSLCPKCDEEAKRLIKEGPKWKRNAKKGRTTVTVPFNNSL